MLVLSLHCLLVVVSVPLELVDGRVLEGLPLLLLLELLAHEDLYQGVELAPLLILLLHSHFLRLVWLPSHLVQQFHLLGQLLVLGNVLRGSLAGHPLLGLRLWWFGLVGGLHNGNVYFFLLLGFLLNVVLVEVGFFVLDLKKLALPFLGIGLRRIAQLSHVGDFMDLVVLEFGLGSIQVGVLGPCSLPVLPKVCGDVGAGEFLLEEGLGDKLVLGDDLPDLGVELLGRLALGLGVEVLDEPEVGKVKDGLLALDPWGQQHDPHEFEHGVHHYLLEVQSPLRVLPQCQHLLIVLLEGFLNGNELGVVLEGHAADEADLEGAEGELVGRPGVQPLGDADLLAVDLLLGLEELVLVEVC